MAPNSIVDLLSEYLSSNVDMLSSAGNNKYLGAGVALLTGFGAALGQGYIGGKAIEALARNPEVEALIFRQYIVGAAICESVAIYGLIISILILFAVS